MIKPTVPKVPMKIQDIDMTHAKSPRAGESKEDPYDHEMDGLYEEPTEGEEEGMASLLDRMKAVAGRLEGEAQSRVSKRIEIEDRWVDDLRQYHGKYDAKMLSELATMKRSRLFFNMTRGKTNSWAARLSDMLFPTDERNWAIKPTPVPEIDNKLKSAASNPEMKEEKENLQAIKDEARTKASAMELEIDDHLTESRYQSKCREIIRDGVKLGTGVLKGPIKSEKGRRNWVAAEDGTHVLTYTQDARMNFDRVDPWSFFPDEDAATVEESESFFERHLYNKKQLRRLKRDPSFFKPGIDRLLTQGPQDAMPDYISRLKGFSDNNDSTNLKYVIWEYHGPLSREDASIICDCNEGNDAADAVSEMVNDMEDAIEELQVVIWFCQGEVIKFGIHHLDSEEELYSVFNLEEDETSVFGYGVPYLMRDPQKAANAAWRMMMDNGSVTAGPQVLIDKEKIVPQNGSWVIKPFKVWQIKKPIMKDQVAPFQILNINSNQAELASIIQMARQFADDETSLPIIAQGEQGAHTTKTQGGMAMLMNSVNVVFRRAVKNFDDNITTPCLRRAYDWLMQFSNDESIKGDFEVDARGSSVLLTREMMGQNLMVMASQFAANPSLAPLLKTAAIMRKVASSHMIPADEIIKTDEELKEELEKLKQEQENQPPEANEMAMKMQLAQFEHQSKMELELMKRDTEMIKLAQQRNISMDKLEAMLQSKELDQNGKERMMAAEIGAQKNMAAQGIPAGGGGHI